MKILLVEDELLIAEDMAEMLEEMGHEPTDICKSWIEVKEAMRFSKPDLALLDIRIQGDKDGVEVGKMLDEEYGLKGIYLTSHSNQTIVERAVKTNPLGYLVKPVRQEDLFVALQMAEKQLKEARKQELPQVLIKVGGLKTKVNIYDITHLESDGNYTHIFINGEKHTSSKMLKFWLEETQLSHFIRIHRSYAVNPERIKTMTATHLELGTTSLPIGRKYKSDLEDLIG